MQRGGGVVGSGKIGPNLGSTVAIIFYKKEEDIRGRTELFMNSTIWFIAEDTKNSISAGKEVKRQRTGG